MPHNGATPSSPSADSADRVVRTLANSYVDRMTELGGYISQAEQLAKTPVEQQRIDLWRHALWDWMKQGREQYLAKP